MSALPKPKSGILDISVYVAGKSKANAAERIIKLSSNENPLGPSPKAIEAYKAHASELHRYPASGAEALRATLAKMFKLDEARIVCGSGSDELIGLLIHAYAGQGDEVLYSEHGFLMYKIYAQSFGATPVTAKEKNLTTDVDALLAAVTPRTRIVFVANPNNPTGTYISGAELKRLREGLRSDIVLVIDAAYAEFADRKDYSAGQELVEMTENTVMLRTFSKMYGIPSLRVGWGYFPQNIADVMNRIRGPFNVSGAGIAAAIAGVQDEAYTNKVRAHNQQWLEKVSKALTELKLKVYESLANFILVEFPSGAKNAKAANEFLLARGIIPREVAAYGLPQCLRITIGTEDENRELIAALTDFMRS